MFQLGSYETANNCNSQTTTCFWRHNKSKVHTWEGQSVNINHGKTKCSSNYHEEACGKNYVFDRRVLRSHQANTNANFLH